MFLKILFPKGDSNINCLKFMDIKNRTELIVNQYEKNKLRNYIADKIMKEENFQVLLATSIFNIIKNRFPCELYSPTVNPYDKQLQVFEHINPYTIYDWEEFLQILIVKKQNTKDIYKATSVKKTIIRDLESLFNQQHYKKYIEEYFKETKTTRASLIKRVPLTKKPSKLAEFTKAGFDIDNLPLDLTENEIRNFFNNKVLGKNFNVSDVFFNTEFNVLELYKKACEIHNTKFDIEKPQKLEFNVEYKNTYKKILNEKFEIISQNNKTTKISPNNKNYIELLKHSDFFTTQQVTTCLNNCYKLIGSKIDTVRKSEVLDAIFDKIAELNAILYEIHKLPATIEDIFKYDITRDYIFSRDVVSIFEYVFINEKTKEEISNLVNFDPKYNFPETRKMRRHFVIHSGGTNTGKTYNSIRKLMEADTGVYLAPLRLLALENQETMLENEVMCSLSTGEEEDIVPYATHISSTVEKANLKKYYDLCVIDECQMIEDRDRGWAWTEAILGMQAPEIHLCTAPIAVDLLIKIIEDCGDTYELIEHERVTPLIFEEENVFSLKHVKPGDALICFSKKKVLNVSSALAKIDKNCSIIYGALPYATRKKQFERFLKKESEIVVSTDAIAMGLNLPIKRIIFLETEKFDGQKVRLLQTEEIKQIAGRAGRRGIYEEGFVNSFKDKKTIKKALETPSQKIEKAKINFPEALTEVDKDLIETVKVWATLSDYSFYEKTDIFRLVYILEQLNDFNLTKKEKLQLASIPFQETEQILLEQWKSYIRQFIDGDIVLAKPRKVNSFNSTTLDALELYYKKLDLYFSFSKNMNMEIDKEWLNEEKLKTAEAINAELVEDLDQYSKKCSRCGKTLPWDFVYNICEDCYSDRYDEFY